MKKKTSTDYEERQRKAVGWLLKEPKWTVGDWLKDIGINVLALIGSIIIVAISLLGIARGFGLM